MRNAGRETGRLLLRNTWWVVLAGGVLAASFAVQSPYMAYAVYAFLLLLGVAHATSRAWLAGLDCERSISRRVLQQGEEAEVRVRVHNARGWPIPWLFVEDYGPEDAPVRGEKRRLAVLMPGRSMELEYALRFPRRGYHRVGPLLMESGDLFGLMKRFRTGEQQDYVSVLPTVAYIDTFNIASKRPQGPVRIRNRIYEDPTRINAVREYRPGDPVRSIHWKATARTGQLQVKTFEPAAVSGGTLFLDLHEDSYLPERKAERMELAITTTASIAYLLQMSGEQVGMITNARDAAEVARYAVASGAAWSRMEADALVGGEAESTRISPLSVRTARSPVQAQKIIENLARVLPGRGLDCVGMLIAEHHGLPRDAALLPVVGHVDERLALTLGAMKMAGFAVTVFYISDTKGFGEASALLAGHGIDCLHIEHERSLHEISPARIGQ